jgi:hypothetical protein
MGIFNKKKRPPDETGLMLQKLQENSKKEFQNIESFFNILIDYNYQNPKTLNMTLEEFLKYLEGKRGEINNKLSMENNSYRANLLFNEMDVINKINSFINSYIDYSQMKTYNIPEINFKKTKLYEFLNIIKNRKEYLNKLLNS